IRGRSPAVDVTLRLRLVITIVVLVAVGLSVFGIATYVLYARSQYNRLDSQLRASAPLVTTQLAQVGGLSDDPGRTRQGPPDNDDNGPGGPDHDRHGAPTVVVPPNTYGELRDSSGTVLSHLQLSSSTPQPKLPATLTAGRLFSTGSVSGSGKWRVYTTTAGPNTAVIAVPMTEVTNSLHRLVLIETVGAAVLLAVLALGSWLALRRELHPLEAMATAARSIT